MFLYDDMFIELQFIVSCEPKIFESTDLFNWLTMNGDVIEYRNWFINIYFF